MGAAPPRVLVVDESAVFAECVATGLRLVGTHDVAVLTDPLTVAAVLDHLAASPREAVVMDSDLGPEVDSQELLVEVARVGPAAYVTMASGDPSSVGRYLDLGAAGVFAKDRPFDELIHAIDDALSGRTEMSAVARTQLADGENIPELSERLRSLSPSEHAVLDLLAAGKLAKAIARERNVSLFTVRAQIRSILLKLGVNSQLAAVALAHRLGRS